MNIIERIFRSVSSFRNKQRLVIMLACSIVLIVTLLCFLAYSIFSFRRDSCARLGAVADIIAADVGAALSFGDHKAITRSLESLRADPSIKQVFILDEQGETCSYYHQSIESPRDELQQILSRINNESRIFPSDMSPEVKRPIIWETTNLGTIIIEQDERIIRDKIIATIGIGALILLVALMFSYMLANHFQLIITTPVTAMVAAMQEVSRTKDYSRRVAASGATDEMDHLADGFNEMLAEIERRDADLLERQEQLYNLANYDALTGLPNRILFNDRLEQALRRAARAGERLAVLFIDLDEFKMINDTHGHRIGDQLLIEASARLADTTRADDTLARLGGDEFTILAQDIKTSDNALLVANKHVENLFHHYDIDGKRLFVSGSIGVAIYPEHGVSVDNLLKHADSAMYLAKEQGKNRVELFSDTLQARITEKYGLSADLHRALERGELELYYQPRKCLTRNSWNSAEVLLRWNHPELGLLLPGKFIPLAEQTGLILSIGEWVIKEACQQLHAWHCQGFHLPSISINVSTLQFQRQDLIGIVRGALASNKLRSQTLELEIVESNLLENSGSVITILKELRALGVRISIDDFGTGFSSLSYLRTLPVDILKIDRSFLVHAHESLEDEQFLAAIVAMSLSLGFEVVVEGVECTEQDLLLKKLNCHEAQGFFYDYPMTANELMQKFRTTQIWRD